MRESTRALESAIGPRRARACSPGGYKVPGGEAPRVVSRFTHTRDWVSKDARFFCLFLDAAIMCGRISVAAKHLVESLITRRCVEYDPLRTMVQDSTAPGTTILYASPGTALPTVSRIIEVLVTAGYWEGFLRWLLLNPPSTTPCRGTLDL